MAVIVAGVAIPWAAIIVAGVAAAVARILGSCKVWLSILLV